MPPAIVRMVQPDADILWWSKEPSLKACRENEAKTRFCRFVCKNTAIGPRSMGGLGNLDWESHVIAFNSQWMTRYVDPSVSQWKDLMDIFLLTDKKTETRNSRKEEASSSAN